MSTGWFYVRDGVQHGPVLPARLKELAESGGLAPADLVWRDGLPEWVAASRLQGLFTPVAPSPPPVPGQAPPPPPPARPVPKGKAAPGRARPPSQGWKEIIGRRRSQVVIVEHTYGLGAGLLISADGLILTNKKVVEDSTNVKIAFFNNTSTRAAVLHVHPTLDLAVVKAAVQGADRFDLAEVASAPVEAGDEVIAIGHPHGLRFTSTRGIVTVVNQRVGEEYYIQHEIPVGPGHDGSPLFDAAGKLVGINSMADEDVQDLGFAVPARLVLTYAQEVIGRIADGDIPVPPDEEILLSEAQATAAGALQVALYSFEGDLQEVGDGCFVLQTADGDCVGVRLEEETLECVSSIGVLPESALHDAGFLRQLLEINYALEQAKFCIDEESELWVVSRRGTAGMDAMEAFYVISSVLEAVTEYGESLEDYLKRFDHSPDIALENGSKKSKEKRQR